MINKRIIAIVAVLFSPLLTYAVTVTTGNVTLILPTDSSQYTLTADQNVFDTLTINSATFDFSLAGGQEILIKSADKKNFTSTLAGSLDCQSSQSVFSVSKPEGESAATVTITPSGTCSGSSGGGGGSPSLGQSSGGGGGGGGATYTPTVAPQTVDKVALLKQQIFDIQAKIADKLAGTPAKPSFGATPPAFGVFARQMDPGDKDDEVRRLQELLRTDPAIYPEGKVTGYYGPLTVAAIRKFQAKYGLPAVGRVGPKTLAKLNEIFAGMAPAPAPTPTPAPTPSPTPAPQANSSQTQAIQDQIKAIQAKLIQEQIKLIQEKIKALQP